MKWTDQYSKFAKCFTVHFTDNLRKVVLECFFFTTFSGAWGYAAHFGELAEEIKADVPEAEVNGFVGRRCKFECFWHSAGTPCLYYKRLINNNNLLSFSLFAYHSH